MIDIKQKGESLTDSPLVEMSLKNLAKPSKINGLRAASFQYTPIELLLIKNMD